MILQYDWSPFEALILQEFDPFETFIFVISLKIIYFFLFNSSSCIAFMFMSNLNFTKIFISGLAMLCWDANHLCLEELDERQALEPFYSSFEILVE